MSFGGDSFMGMPMSLGQTMFMAEAEGVTDMVDTDEARFNAAIKEMRSELAWARGTDYDATDEINSILYRHDISPGSLSRSQIKRIERAVA